VIQILYVLGDLRSKGRNASATSAILRALVSKLVRRRLQVRVTISQGGVIDKGVQAAVLFQWRMQLVLMESWLRRSN